MPFDLRALGGFLKASRGKAQEDVVFDFLRSLIDRDPIIDNGSILINYPQEQKLRLFQKETLLSQKFLDPRSSNWEDEFSYRGNIVAGRGVAVRCFLERRTRIYESTTGQQSDLIGNSPIKNMICVPIMLGNLEEAPFGVVCFHNDDPQRKFTPAEGEIVEACVDVLSLALHASYPKILLERNVFIVHGRDSNARAQLENLLLKSGVTPKTLRDEERVGQLILPAIENLIRACAAGFILITPDDEGRLRDPDNPDCAFTLRARENVLFETGLLFAQKRPHDRVAVLVKRGTTLPTDLQGMLYYDFDEIENIDGKIRGLLGSWKLVS